MKILLRSTFVCTPTDDADLFFRNYLALHEAGLSHEVPQDELIWQFIKDFAQTHNHVPDLVTLRSHFQNINEVNVVDRLEVLTGFHTLTRGDFLKRIEDKAHDRRVRKVHEILKEAVTITQTGLEVGETKKEKRILRGPIDAMRHVLDQSHDIVSPTLGSRLYGEITKDGEDFLEEYKLRKSDPLTGIGQMTGIGQIDEALSGAKPHELWTHAAFTGGLKSTLMFNWAYNQAVYYGSSSCIFSLEVPYHQCRRILFSIHSMHEKFRDIRTKLGIQQKPKKNQSVQNIGLPYKHIRDGSLEDWHPNSEKFMEEYVIPDFSGQKVVEWDRDPPGGYGEIHLEVADPDKDDFTMADIRQKSEVLYSKAPFELLFIDHMGLLAPRKWSSSTTERLNEVVRDAKRLAMNFQRGQGIAVVGLFQISREGFKAAEKNEGRYNLTHLSYANECERSSDIVTTTFVNDELRKKNRVQFQCLKSRDDAPFDLFSARVEWPCRRILTTYEVPLVSAQQEAVGGEIDNLDKALDA